MTTPSNRSGTLPFREAIEAARKRKRVVPTHVQRLADQINRSLQTLRNSLTWTDEQRDDEP